LGEDFVVQAYGNVILLFKHN